MFRVNPLNVFRQLREPAKAYRRVFKDASTAVTVDEIELARKIKGEARSSQSNNHYTGRIVKCQAFRKYISIGVFSSHDRHVHPPRWSGGSEQKW